jgi:hypothetical protein
MNWLKWHDVCDREEFGKAFKQALGGALQVDHHVLHTLLDVAGALRPCIVPLLLMTYPQVRARRQPVLIGGPDFSEAYRCGCAHPVAPAQALTMISLAATAARAHT